MTGLYIFSFRFLYLLVFWTPESWILAVSSCCAGSCAAVRQSVGAEGTVRVLYSELLQLDRRDQKKNGPWEGWPQMSDFLLGRRMMMKKNGGEGPSKIPFLSPGPVPGAGAAHTQLCRDTHCNFSLTKGRRRKVGRRPAEVISPSSQEQNSPRDSGGSALPPTFPRRLQRCHRD